MINLEKITVFHKEWDSAEGVHRTVAKVYTGHWFEHQVVTLEGNGLVRSKEIKLRIPKDLHPTVEISAADRIARGEHSKLPADAGTVLIKSDNWKGANPHWLIIGK